MQFDQTRGRLDDSAAESTEDGQGKQTWDGWGWGGFLLLASLFLIPNLVSSLSLLRFGITGFSLSWQTQFLLGAIPCVKIVCPDLGLWEEKNKTSFYLYTVHLNPGFRIAFFL